MAGEDPYLPAPVLADNPADSKPGPKKPQAQRTLLVWVLLIFAFAIVYNLVGGAAHHNTLPACRPETTGTDWFWRIAPLLAAGLFVAWIFRQLGNVGSHNLDIEPALIATAEGDHARARAVYLEHVAKYEKKPAYAASMRNCAADSSIRLGDFDRARDDLLVIERGAGLFFSNGPRLWATVSLARTFALAGELERARAWSASAKERLARTSDPRLGHACSLQLTDAVILARAGDDAAALRLLENGWLRMAGTFNGPQLALALLVRAYLTARTSDARAAGVTERWVAPLRAFPTVDFAYAWRAWPELAELAATQGLSTNA